MSVLPVPDVSELTVTIEYVITMPNMYARGILFGKMVLELGDMCTATNKAHGLQCDLEFKTKGFFSGTYNAIAGRVHKGSTDIGEVTGKWSQLMEFKSAKVRSRGSVAARSWWIIEFFLSLSFR